MKDNIIVNGVTEETLAAYFDGVATAEECDLILKSLDESDELSEIMSISMAVDRDLTLSANHIEILPMRAAAASAGSTCTCSLECEKYILNRRGIAYDEEKLMEMSLKNNWQTDEGTALHNIGRHLEHKGLSVIRRYKCSIDDIIEALAANDDIIVAVDGGELLGNAPIERIEDALLGEMPDHTVVVIACDMDAQTITLFDPNSSHPSDTYSLTQFANAWKDARNYLVSIQ
jgi:hypothetical protein